MNISRWFGTPGFAAVVLVCLLTLGGSSWGQDAGAEADPAAAAIDRLTVTDEAGRLLPRPYPVDRALANPVHSDDWLEGYRTRTDRLLRTAMTQRFSFSTYFENEKYALGHAMARTLSGDKAGRDALSATDAQANDWHKETAGIDYYACFVIKHQPRKYFYFKDVLPPAYRQQMFDGAKSWTGVDPLRRPHHMYDSSKRNQGWGPDARNSWVDVRGTDNLMMMRSTAVYLMAEETGSAEVAQKYKQELLGFAAAMYRVGNGEWDSENYLGHTMTPLFNTHDFAKDPEVRAASKAMLDWLAAAMAVKYYRGAANGPTKRDYNHVQPLGGSLAETAWMMFGAPVDPKHFEYDLIHMVTSGWVPPPAIVNLGTNNFDRPRELLNTKPSYSEPQRGNWKIKPAFHETYYIGRTFEFGSLAEGTSTDGGDVNGFKIMADDDRRGVFDLQIAPTARVDRIGSPQYQQGVTGGPNRVAQYRNLAIWLVKNGTSDWSAVLPESVPVEVVDGVTFLRGDSTWMALHPINMSAFAVDEERTQNVKGFTAQQRVRVEEVDPETGKTTRVNRMQPVYRERWPEHRGLAAKGGGAAGFSGFAIEVGESPDYADYAAFKAGVLANAKLELDKLAGGEVGFVSSTGSTVRMAWADNPAGFKVWRDGELHDWAEHGKYAYREAGKLADGLIFQQWGDDGGTLTVNAGGRSFTSTVTPEGKATFENR